MLTRAEKGTIVDAFKGRFMRQRVSIFARHRGVSVAKLTAFRRELKRAGAEFKVAKKTLLRRALEDSGVGINPEELEGEIGVIFGYEDQVVPAKIAAKFSKENEGFTLVRGILDGKLLDVAGVMALAKLPSREELLASVARAMQAPIRNLAIVLQMNIRNLAVVLQHVAENKKYKK